MKPSLRGLVSVVLVCTALVLPSLPQDHGTGLIGSASAAPLSFSFAKLVVGTQGLAQAPPGSSGAPDLVLARAQETFDPSIDLIPTGVPDAYWNLYYLDQLSSDIEFVQARDPSSSRVLPAGPVYSSGIAAFWASRVIHDFLMSSEQAVAIAHANGGATASIGRPAFQVDYQLIHTGTAPTWDIVYRDSSTLEAFFVATVDAMQGIPIGNSLSYPGMDIDVALLLADATTTFATDAKLTAALAIEGPPVGLRSEVFGAWGRMEFPPSTIEEKLGDALGSTWYLEYVSSSLGKTKLYLVMGADVVELPNYPTSAVAADRLAGLSQANSRPRLLDLEDAWGEVETAHANGVIDNVHGGMNGRVSSLSHGLLEPHTSNQAETWRWGISGVDVRTHIHWVDAYSGDLEMW